MSSQPALDIHRKGGWFTSNFAMLRFARISGSLHGQSGHASSRLLAPTMLVSLSVLVPLPTGNFHLAAVAGSMIAMVAFARGHRAAGGALLSFLSLASWLALLQLTALRSPFVPNDYALFVPLWLITLLACRSLRTPRSIALFTAGWLIFAFMKLPLTPGISASFITETLLQLASITLCTWAVVRSTPEGDRQSALVTA